MKYNKEQKNPFSNKWEVTGVATLSEEDADILNTHSEVNGVRYVKAEKKKSTKK